MAGSGLAAGIVLAGALAGCSGGTSSTATATSTPPASSFGKVTTTADGTQEVSLRTQDNYVFTPARFTVKPGKVQLTVVNAGRDLTHNFEFAPQGNPAAIGAAIPLLPAGQKQTISFTVTTPGTYRFECSFHVDLGQVGTMTVGG